MNHGPLTGMKMIECMNWGFGPIGGMMLGDLGADIIKIESANRPDPVRYLMNLSGIDNLMPDGQSASYQSFNRNKRSLGLDLKAERGQAIFKDLIKETDSLLESYRPGTLDKLGLGYEVLSQINPALIYCATSGYGFKGEEWNKPALDAVGQARSGFMWSMGAPGDPPNWNVLSVADVMGSMCVAYGILAAVVERERNGGMGQKVEVSHINSNMWLAFWGISVCMLKGYDDWPRFDRKHAGNPLWNLYECADGEWIMLGIGDVERDWPKFCEVVDLRELRDDPRLRDDGEASAELCGVDRDPGRALLAHAAGGVGKPPPAQPRPDLLARAADQGPADGSGGGGEHLFGRLRPSVLRQDQDAESPRPSEPDAGDDPVRCAGARRAYRRGPEGAAGVQR